MMETPGVSTGCKVYTCASRPVCNFEVVTTAMHFIMISYETLQRVADLDLQQMPAKVPTRCIMANCRAAPYYSDCVLPAAARHA